MAPQELLDHGDLRNIAPYVGPDLVTSKRKLHMKRLAGAILLLSIVVTGIHPVLAARHDYEAFDCPGERRAVVLGGGGVRGAYQAGAKTR